MLDGTNLSSPPLIPPWTFSVGTPIPLARLFDSPSLLPEASSIPGTANGQYREHTAQGPVVSRTPTRGIVDRFPVSALLFDSLCVGPEDPCTIFGIEYLATNPCIIANASGRLRVPVNDLAGEWGRVVSHSQHLLSTPPPHFQ